MYKSNSYKSLRKDYIQDIKENKSKNPLGHLDRWDEASGEMIVFKRKQIPGKPPRIDYLKQLREERIDKEQNLTG